MGRSTYADTISERVARLVQAAPGSGEAPTLSKLRIFRAHLIERSVENDEVDAIVDEFDLLFPEASA